MARKNKGTKPTQEQATAPTPLQRPATLEAATIQARQQRARAEVAVLKQRFAETDVRMTIAEAERDQLIQQQQFLQQRITTLEEENAALKKTTKSGKEPESKEE